VRVHGVRRPGEPARAADLERAGREAAADERDRPRPQ